jgi:tRNA pseudouridine38-40 synthase
MNRYFLELRYLGTPFSGWQRQNNAVSIQQTIEDALSVLLQESIEVVGCGRTDSGVHADQYYAHFDTGSIVNDDVLFRLNQMVGESIHIVNYFQVEPKAHARFDAIRRQYRYYISGNKPVFASNLCWYLTGLSELNQELIASYCSLLSKYDSFKPFCKTDSGVTHYKCASLRIHWDYDESAKLGVFEVESNRFLRGMVRLIVGTSIYVAKGLLTISEVEEYLDSQKALPKTFSAPACGLFLNWISYPFIENKPVRRPTQLFLGDLLIITGYS